MKTDKHDESVAVNSPGESLAFTKAIEFMKERLSQFKYDDCDFRIMVERNGTATFSLNWLDEAGDDCSSREIVDLVQGPPALAQGPEQGVVASAVQRLLERCNSNQKKNKQ